MRLLVPTAVSIACCLATIPLRADELPSPRPEPRLRTFLHIETPQPLSLRRNVGRFGIPLCPAPCDQIIAYDESDLFSVTGDFVPVQPFRLGPGGPRTTLRVDPGSRGAFYTGVTSATLGASAVTMGAVLLLIGFERLDVLVRPSAHRP